MVLMARASLYQISIKRRFSVQECYLQRYLQKTMEHTRLLPDHLFDGSISQMIKIALRRYLRGQAVNDVKFEILKDAAKTGDLSKINDSFFVLKPKIVRFIKPREYGIIFE